MSNKTKLAEQKFVAAMEALIECGESPLNYCLAYARGHMHAQGEVEYLHEWEDGTMRLRLQEGEQIH